jgi:hypothetical protein
LGRLTGCFTGLQEGRFSCSEAGVWVEKSTIWTKFFFLDKVAVWISWRRFPKLRSEPVDSCKLFEHQILQVLVA